MYRESDTTSTPEVPSGASPDARACAAALADLEERLPLEAMAETLGQMWRRGWQPLEAARLVEGIADGFGRRVFVDAAIIDRRGWHRHAAPLWAQQADRLGASTPWWDAAQPYWPQVVERLGMHPLRVTESATVVSDALRYATRKQVLETPPCRPAAGVGADGADATLLARVRALLAKAESTTFAAEAEALTAKAQQLIARHAIDVALLRDDAEVPGGRHIPIDRPYARPKFALLWGIANANGCRSCLDYQREVATVMGHRDDLHLVEVLYTSLLVQGTGAVLAASRRGDVEGPVRAWRHAFWTGFADRISRRLAEASAAARTSYRRSHGDDLLPVLDARRDAVDRAFAEAFPDLHIMRQSVSSPEGLAAGRRFADRVRLDAGGDVDSGGRRAIGR